MAVPALSKLNILRTPLPELPFLPRLALRALLLGFGHWLTVEAEHPLDSVKDPAIFALNHNCSYETLLVPCYLFFRRRGRTIGFISDWMFGRIPLLGWFFKQIDPIYVYNKPARFAYLNRHRAQSVRRSIVAQCVARLRAGRSLAVFPEGTRNRDPQVLLRGRQGIGQIVLQSDAPLLPIGIDFPERLAHQRIPNHGPLILRIGAPLLFSEERLCYRRIAAAPGVPAASRKRLLDHVSQRVTYAVMIELARLSGKNYPFPVPEPPPDWERFFHSIQTDQNIGGENHGLFGDHHRESNG